MADFHVEHADWTLDSEALHALRDTVFVQEQNVPAEEEWDGLDPRCEHVLAISEDGTAIGCGRLTPEHKIGRMAVLADWRGRGVGAAMLQVLIEIAREHGWESVSLHAQVTAIDFYQKHGFEGVGERFMEAGIEHWTMQRALDPIEPPPAERGKPPPRPAAENLKCTTRSELKAALLTLLDQARYKICIHSQILHPTLPDDDDVLAALRRLATSGRLASLRFLISDADRVLRDDHRLVNLAQRLESSIRIRVITEQIDRDYPSAFVLNDAGGYLLQVQADMPNAFGSTRAPGEHSRLQHYFNEVWERSVPASALRKLDL
ncbi:MAG: GNAT family N-acetyltransferase [Rhodanobacteraceae bacterium]